MKLLKIPSSDGHFAKMLGLVKEVDSVELKLKVKDTDYHSAIDSLEMDVLDAEIRQIVFFETSDLQLSRTGLVVRARRTRRGADTVIKLRPVVPAELPNDLRHSHSFNVEVDAMPGSLICSGSLRGKADNTDVRMAVLAKRPIRKLFSREQRALYRQRAPKGLELDSLKAFGPINTLKLKWTPKNFTRILVAEVWFYPDGSRILELSTKCSPNEAFQVLAETRVFLLRHGISLTGEQETKTRKALHYFSHLRNGRK